MTFLRSMSVAAALLAFVLCACGGSRPQAVRAGTAWGRPSLVPLLVDEDHDGRGGGYYDGDDGEVKDFGHAAATADANAIASLVKRYYAAAAAGNATSACALTYYLDRETLPEHYGEPPTPRWLLGAKTCKTLLARVLSHFHDELAVPVTVTAVRVNGDRGDALVGFKTLPAGYVAVRRGGSSWKVDGLLATSLP
jgi:hypothetical protein